MKFLLGLFVFLFFILGISALIGIWVIKGISNFFSGIFKNPAQDDRFYSKKQENNADNSVIIEGEVVKESVIEKYIKEINQSKIGLDSDVASALSSLTDIMKKMDSYISNHQNNEKDIKVMTEHYIPELLKHIKVFKELSSSSFTNVHKEDIKKELLETISMITNAYSTVLSEFYDSMALSVSSSLEAIKSSIKLKGYIK